MLRYQGLFSPRLHVILTDVLHHRNSYLLTVIQSTFRWDVELFQKAVDVWVAHEDWRFDKMLKLEQDDWKREALSAESSDAVSFCSWPMEGAKAAPSETPDPADYELLITPSYRLLVISLFWQLEINIKSWHFCCINAFFNESINLLKIYKKCYS